MLVLNAIYPVTDEGQEEYCHKYLSGLILIMFSLVHPGKAHDNNPEKYIEALRLLPRKCES